MAENDLAPKGKPNPKLDGFPLLSPERRPPGTDDTSPERTGVQKLDLIELLFWGQNLFGPKNGGNIEKSVRMTPIYPEQLVEKKIDLKPIVETREQQAKAMGRYERPHEYIVTLEHLEDGKLVHPTHLSNTVFAQATIDPCGVLGDVSKVRNTRNAIDFQEEAYEPLLVLAFRRCAGLDNDNGKTSRPWTIDETDQVLKNQLLKNQIGVFSDGQSSPLTRRQLRILDAIPAGRLDLQPEDIDTLRKAAVLDPLRVLKALVCAQKEALAGRQKPVEKELIKVFEELVGKLFRNKPGSPDIDRYLWDPQAAALAAGRAEQQTIAKANAKVDVQTEALLMVEKYKQDLKTSLSSPRIERAPSPEDMKIIDAIIKERDHAKSMIALTHGGIRVDHKIIESYTFHDNFVRKNIPGRESGLESFRTKAPTDNDREYLRFILEGLKQLKAAPRVSPLLMAEIMFMPDNKKGVANAREITNAEANELTQIFREVRARNAESNLDFLQRYYTDPAFAKWVQDWWKAAEAGVKAANEAAAAAQKAASEDAAANDTSVAEAGSSNGDIDDGSSSDDSGAGGNTNGGAMLASADPEIPSDDPLMNLDIPSSDIAGSSGSSGSSLQQDSSDPSDLTSYTNSTGDPQNPISPTGSGSSAAVSGSSSSHRLWDLLLGAEHAQKNRAKVDTRLLDILRKELRNENGKGLHFDSGKDPLGSAIKDPRKGTDKDPLGSAIKDPRKGTDKDPLNKTGNGPQNPINNTIQLPLSKAPRGPLKN